LEEIDPEFILATERGNGALCVASPLAKRNSYRQIPLGTADNFIKSGTLDFNAAVKHASKRSRLQQWHLMAATA